jgi:hypothetical protein
VSLLTFNSKFNLKENHFAIHFFQQQNACCCSFISIFFIILFAFEEKVKHLRIVHVRLLFRISYVYLYSIIVFYCSQFTLFTRLTFPCCCIIKVLLCIKLPFFSLSLFILVVVKRENILHGERIHELHSCSGYINNFFSIHLLPSTIASTTALNTQST